LKPKQRNIKMVEVEEIIDAPMEVEKKEVPSQAAERLLDAEEIESTLSHITRPTARAQIEALVAKVKRDAAALKRMETSQALSSDKSADVTSAPAAITPTPIQTTKLMVEKKKYLTIDKFAFDAGQYNTPTVTLYVPLPSPSPTDVQCNFTNTSFDLQIRYSSTGKEYRLFKDNLDKDIEGEKCKYIVKSDKVVIKLRKVKGEYGSYDSWTDLTAKKTGIGKSKSKSKKDEDPSASIMNLMKDMYDSGDDKMKKMIGETMLKQREGKMGDGPGGMGMGGMDGMGGMGDM